METKRDIQDMGRCRLAQDKIVFFMVPPERAMGKVVI